MVVAQEWDLTRQLELDERSQKEWLKYQEKYATDANHAFFVLTCGRYQYMVAMNAVSGKLEAALDIPFLNATQN